jgi:hypothetical protein
MYIRISELSLLKIPAFHADLFFKLSWQVTDIYSVEGFILTM